MSKIIDGKMLAEKIKDQIIKEILTLNGVRPNLAIILVGEREDSKLYVDLKEKEAKKVGIDTHLYKCDDGISERELLEMLEFLNQDESIDAILVQLPLPQRVDTDTIIMSIDPAKDIDGFHPDNLEKLLKNCPPRRRYAHLDSAKRVEAGDFNCLMPPVFAVVMEMLKSIDYEVKNKQVCIISNSIIFGKSLGHIFSCSGAKAEVIGIQDKNLAKKTLEADILITAVGKPKFIKKEMVKNDAVIIDIGISKLNGQVSGDVDFDDVKEKAGYLTPVPGGVGPMTIAMAFKNTLEIYKKRHKV